MTLILDLFILFMFTTCMRGTHGGQKRALDPLGLGLQILWATIWMMGTESWSSLGAVSALNCWASSSASQIPLNHEEITVKIRIYFDNENDLPVGHICRVGWMHSGRVCTYTCKGLSSVPCGSVFVGIDEWTGAECVLVYAEALRSVLSIEPK